MNALSPCNSQQKRRKWWVSTQEKQSPKRSHSYNVPTIKALNISHLLTLPTPRLFRIRTNHNPCLYESTSQAIHKSTHHRFNNSWADEVLLNPMVLNELSFALSVALRISICVIAFNGLDIFFPRKLVANILAERCLLRRPLFLPPPATRVRNPIIRARTPSLQNLMRSLIVLCDYETGVEICLVVLGVVVDLVNGIEGQSHGCRRGEVPAVEQPFKWKVEVHERGVCVDGDCNVAALDGECRSEGWDFGPVRCFVGEGGCVYEVIGVAVDHC